MAIGVASDFQIYDEQIQGGLTETLVQQSQAFNAASNNAIRLVAGASRGDYRREAFAKSITSLVARRDTTAVTAATDLAVSQDSFIAVKVNRRIGPVAQTLDSFRKIGSQANVDSLSFMIGAQVAKAIQVDQLNTALTSAVSAFGGVTSTNGYTVPTNGTLATNALIEGLAVMGDAANRVVCWVMHSKAYFDLVKEQITQKIEGVSNLSVATATPVTCNRPVLVVDSDALAVTTGSGSAAVTDYMTLGLVEDAVVLEDSEEAAIHADLVTGLENLVVRLQGEFAYTVGVRGFAWDVSNGGANPTNTALGTSTNWDKVATSAKDLCGVRIQSR